MTAGRVTRLLREARSAWASDDPRESVLAVLLGVAALFLALPTLIRIGRTFK